MPLNPNARSIGRPSSALYRGARELERKGFNGQKLAEQAAVTKLSEPNIYRDGQREAEISANERVEAGLLAQRRDAALEARGVTVEATGGRLAGRRAIFEEAKKTGAFTPEMRTRGAALGISESGFALAQSRLPKPPVTTSPVSQPALGTAGAPPPGATDGASPTVQKPMTTEAMNAANTPYVKSDPNAAGSLMSGLGSVLAGINAGQPARVVGERDAKDRSAAVSRAITESAGKDNVTRSSVIDTINKERIAAGRTPFGEDIYNDIAKAAVDRKSAGPAAAPNLSAPTKGPMQSALDEAMARREERSYAENDASLSGEVDTGFRNTPDVVKPSAPEPTKTVDLPTYSTAPMQQFDSRGRTGADLPAYYTPKQVPLYPSSKEEVQPDEGVFTKDRPFKSTLNAGGSVLASRTPPATPTGDGKPEDSILAKRKTYTRTF